MPWLRPRYLLTALTVLLPLIALLLASALLTGILFRSPANAGVPTGPGAVSTLFGIPGTSGSADTTLRATFNGPAGECYDAAGNLYVTDGAGNKIRKVSPSGVVTTLAGSGTGAETDGSGAAASFNGPAGICLASDGNLYVTDSTGNKIRKLTLAGVVTTLAGSGTTASTDGSGAAASFYNPWGICQASDGTLTVTDYGSNDVRRVSLSGAVSTLYGVPGTSGSADTTGRATFYSPAASCYDAAGNLYVADQTNNKIEDLLPPGSILNSTKLVLTDAVYFNAAWNTPFDPNNTHDGSFTLLDGSNVTVSFMNAELPSLPATQGTNFVAASLPYADESLSLVVVLPDTGQFSQVESSLDAPALGTIVAGLRLTSQPVQLALPRFKIETGTSLVRLLTNLGMKSAFDSSGAADFSSMDGTRFLYLSEIIHKAFIDVTEAGTEAAAVTIVVGTGRGGIAMPVNFTANRPYLYFLRDQPTGAILFMGRVLDPSQN